MLTLLLTFCKFLFSLDHTIPTFNNPEKESFEKIVGKRENAGNQHFLLFPNVFTLLKGGPSDLETKVLQEY